MHVILFSVFLCIFKKSSPEDMFLLILERDKGGEREATVMWERNMDWLPPIHAWPGIKPAT